MNLNKNYIGAALISLAAFFFWGWILPGYNVISELKTLVRERQDLISSRSAIIANIKNLTEEYQKHSADIKKRTAVVPNKKSVAEIVSTMENIASRNGLQLTGETISEQKSEPGAPYDSVLIDISLSGGYTSLVNMLQSLEKNLRLLDVSSIDVNPGTSSSGAAFLNFRVKMSAYFVK